MPYKLGRNAPKYNPKTLFFSRYLADVTMPVPPTKTFWEYKINPTTIGMYANDKFGDCTCAEVAHHLMTLTAHTRSIVVPTLQEVLDMYSAVSGFDQKTGANDNGAAITDILNYWQTTGLSGHKILGWVSIDPTNQVHRRLAVYLFGGASVGVNLPDSAQDQFPSETWDVVSGAQNEGGHCIYESGYGLAGHNFASWGKGDVKATNAWDSAYTEEAYAVITNDWIDVATGLAPNALNIDQLRADLQAIAS